MQQVGALPVARPSAWNVEGLATFESPMLVYISGIAASLDYGYVRTHVPVRMSDDLLCFCDRFRGGGSVGSHRAARAHWVHVELAERTGELHRTRERGGAIGADMKFNKELKGRSTAGGGGGAAASAEDLRERLEREALMEMRKQYSTKARRRLKADLKREAEYSATNKLKIQNQWRKIMRLAKVESLRKDIEILSQNHERDVDRKDAVIQMLDRDLEESEEQYQMALRSHLQNIDALIDLQDSRLLALENEFENDLQTLEDEFKAERQEIDGQHDSERTEIRDIMAAVEIDEQENDTERKHEHEQLREEIRSKNQENINNLRVMLENQIEELEKHFRLAHYNYLQNTDQHTQDFKYLTAQDQTLSKDIEIQILKIERLQQTLSHWRAKINTNNKECTKRNRALRSERDAIARHFKELKSRMNAFRASEKKKLSELTQNAHWAKDELDNKLKIARKIVGNAQVAQQLETEMEKVRPFFTTAMKAQEAAAAAVDESKTQSSAGGKQEVAEEKFKDDDTKKAEDELRALLSGCGPSSESAGADVQLIDENTQSSGYRSYGQQKESGEGPAIEEWDYLNWFNRKFNKVLMDKITIERQREELQRENADLQSILKQFLDGISVNEEVLSAPNPLLVVNGRSNMSQQPVARHLKPSIVDGNQMVNTGRVNTQWMPGF